MSMNRLVHALSAFLLLAGASHANGSRPDWQTGKVELSSAGALALGPEGVLFLADPEGARIFALNLGATSTPSAAEAAAQALPALDVPSLDEILSFLLGSARASITINDLVFDPAGVAYVSLTRGKGKDALPAIARIHGAEEVEIVALDDVPHLSVSLENAPDPDDGGPRSRRTQSITDLAFDNGVLYVAGLSNEEFASKLRALAFPFEEAGPGASIEIYHASHGAWETRAPVRAMVPIDLGGSPNLLCGYTCTPLVRVPVKAIETETKFVGTTVAELGNGNTPLDMVVYQQGGAGYLLIANTSRGVMKLPTAGLLEAEGLTERVRAPSGMGYETIEALENVVQLTPFDATRALVLLQTDTGVDLKTIDLP